MLGWEYDVAADALYLHLSTESIARQHEMPDGAVVDLDASGAVVGIDIVSFRGRFDVAAVAEEFGLEPEVVTSVMFLVSSLAPPMRATPQVASFPTFASV